MELVWLTFLCLGNPLCHEDKRKEKRERKFLDLKVSWHRPSGFSILGTPDTV